MLVLKQKCFLYEANKKEALVLALTRKHPHPIVQQSQTKNNQLTRVFYWPEVSSRQGAPSQFYQAKLSQQFQTPLMLSLAKIPATG